MKLRRESITRFGAFGVALRLVAKEYASVLCVCLVSCMWTGCVERSVTVDQGFSPVASVTFVCSFADKLPGYEGNKVWVLMEVVQDGGKTTLLSPIAYMNDQSFSFGSSPDESKMLISVAGKTFSTPRIGGLIFIHSDNNVMMTVDTDLYQANISESSKGVSYEEQIRDRFHMLTSLVNDRAHMEWTVAPNVSDSAWTGPEHTNARSLDVTVKIRNHKRELRKPPGEETGNSLADSECEQSGNQDESAGAGGIR